MKKKRYLIKIVLLLILIISMNVYVFKNKKTSESVLSKDIIVVGMELKFPPFETVDKNGNPSGVSVDLANALGEKLNKKIVIKSIDYPSLIPALQSGNIDMIISSMTKTEERLQSIDFTEEYAKSDLGLLLNKNINININDFKDLNNSKYKIAVKQGTLGAMWAKKNLQNATIKEFSEVSAGMLDVNNGQSDAFIYDPLTLIEGSQNLSNVKVDIRPLPGVSGWGIGLRHGDDSFKLELNKALEEVKKDGFFEKMREKYLKDEVEKYKSYGLPYFF